MAVWPIPMTILPCQEISDTIGQLFDCSQVNGFTRIRTPYLYPDGDVIDLFLKDQGGQQILTDLGETLRWLDMQVIGKQLSKKQTQVLQDIELNHGIENYQGTLIARVTETEALAEAVTRLAQAAIRVADLWFLARTRALGSVADEVAELLSEVDVRFERDEKNVGRSGRNWYVDFHTWHPNHSSLVQVLSTGSRGAARTKANNAIAAWTDLSHYKMRTSPVRFISLFDDTIDVWSQSTISHLEDYSDIAYWSSPKVFVKMLVSRP